MTSFKFITHIKELEYERKFDIQVSRDGLNSLIERPFVFKWIYKINRYSGEITHILVPPCLDNYALAITDHYYIEYDGNINNLGIEKLGKPIYKAELYKLLSEATAKV